MAPIEPLGWRVFVEQPVSEVYARLNASILWTAGLLLAGLAMSALAAGALARSMVRPIRTLDEGARRIGAGELDQRIDIKTGDELEGLAEQFNRMSSQLRESYAGLERKVEERTAELTELLEYQIATAEVLQVISSSVSDTRPVFEKILDSCQKLFPGASMGITLVGDDGQMHLNANRSPRPADFEEIARFYPRPVEQSIQGLAIRKRQVLHFTGLQQEAAVPEDLLALARRIGDSSMLVAPMLWEDRGVGAINLYRQPATPFGDKEIGLLKTFADQAVIAIQNVRLFNETKEALEQQTATAEVLQVISASVADTQPVFDKILRSCERLFAGDEVGILLAGDDGQLHFGAQGGAKPYLQMRARLPAPLDGSATALAIRERRVLHYEHVLTDADVPPVLRELAAGRGFDYSMALAPMLWEGRGVGSIFVTQRRRSRSRRRIWSC